MIALQIQLPSPHMLTDLAPRIEGRGDYRGEYGYALAITATGKVRCLLDEGGVFDLTPNELVFLHFGNRPD